MKRKSIELFLLLSVLNGCFLDKSEMDDGPAKMTQSQYENDSLRCAEKDGCPSAVVSLHWKDGVDYYRGSGFVLNTNAGVRIITNNHNIPTDCKDSGKCSSMRVSFQNGEYNNLKDSKSIDEVSVVRVSDSRSNQKLYNSEDNDSDADYAVLEVNDIPSYVVPLRQSSAPDSNHYVSLFGVYENDNDHLLEVRQTECSTVWDSEHNYFLDHKNHFDKAVLLTHTCETKSGTSGSPLIDKDGNVFAVHQSVISDSYLSDLERRTKTKQDKVRFATNLSAACLEEESCKLQDSSKPFDIKSKNTKIEDLLKQKLNLDFGSKIKSKLERYSFLGSEITDNFDKKLAFNNTGNRIIAFYALEKKKTFSLPLPLSKSYSHEFIDLTDKVKYDKQMRPKLNVDYLNTKTGSIDIFLEESSYNDLDYYRYYLNHRLISRMDAYNN